MKPASLILALVMLASWQTAAFAGDWYVHRETRQMKEPPYYCYCYSRSKASVLAGKVTYPIDMQISEEQAISKVESYAGRSDSCANNCGAGFGAGRDDETAGPPPPPTAPKESPECKKLAEVGGCDGFCRGFGAGYEDTLGAAIDKCISDCRTKYPCGQ